jgi:hypothetical protein
MFVDWFLTGKDCYDNRKEKKLRCPAWCDRVLWRIGKHSANTAQGFQSESDDTDDGSVADEGDDTDNNSSQAFPGSAKEQTVPELVPGDSALEVELNLDSEMGAQGGATSGGKGGTSSEKKFLLQDSQSALNGKAGGTSSASPLYECQESVELMMYDRCDNVISDHKPVRAILNLKVKRLVNVVFNLSGTDFSIFFLSAEWTGRRSNWRASPSIASSVTSRRHSVSSHVTSGTI